MMTHQGALLSALFLCWQVYLVQSAPIYFQGEKYWNERHAVEGRIKPYTDVDRKNGLWSHQSDTKGPYLYTKAEYEDVERCVGCTCDDIDNIVHKCKSKDIIIRYVPYLKNITADMFSSTTIETITITNCPGLENITSDAFSKLTELKEVRIQMTKLKTFPNVTANTKLKILNLANNKIGITSLTYVPQTLPSTLTHVALMNNEIHWLPPDLFSNSKVEILGLSYNKFEQFPAGVFENMNDLRLLALNGNKIKTISKAQLSQLAGKPNFQHLNLSNNEISMIASGALSQLSHLKIIELHENKFTELLWESFYQIPELVHLDLNNNYLERLGRKALMNLPKLHTLILHSQKNKMKVINYDAFINISLSLQILWVGSNELTTFPHQVLSEENYPEIRIIYADNNLIKDPIKYGDEAFSIKERTLHAQKNFSHVPFKTLKNLNSLWLNGNQLKSLGSGEFCELKTLSILHLESNGMTENSIHEFAFACLGSLTHLYLDGNRMQYIPDAIKYEDRLPKIYLMKMNNNKLTFLESGAFANLSTIKQLYFRANDIITIEDGTFPPWIEHLQLSENQFRFQHTNPFKGLGSLRTLHLADNQITIIPDDAFHGNFNMTDVTLHRNKIGRVMKTHFKDNPIRFNFNFAGNEIGYIEDGTMAHFSRLKHVNFANNRLTRLPNGGDFHNLIISEKIELQGNQITHIEGGTFKNLQVKEKFYLNNNRIRRIESGAFENVKVTEQFDVKNNYLQELQTLSFKNCEFFNIDMQKMEIEYLPPSTFQDVTVNDFLYLQENKIHTIDEKAFDKVVVARQLELSNNNITKIVGRMFGDGTEIKGALTLNLNNIPSLPGNVFQGAQMTRVYLNQNKLTVFPTSQLAAQTGLKQLSITNNLMEDIPFGALTPLVALEGLNAKFNKIKRIPEALFATNTKLQTIELSNNEIVQIADNVFDNLEELHTINLPNNKITYFPTLNGLQVLAYLDLENNQIGSFGKEAFGNMLTKKLKYVKLLNNPLNCDCNTYISLQKVAIRVEDAICSKTSKVSGTSFSNSDKSKSTYFTKAKAKDFQCSAYNVSASSPALYQVSVQWEPPTFLYPPSASGSNSWKFTLKCTDTNTSVSLTKEVTYNPNSPVATLDHLFQQADGVVAGTTYMCSLELTAGGYTSAPSPPTYTDTQPVFTAPVPTLPPGASNTTTISTDDILLKITHNDFGITHPDFTGLSTSVIPATTYIPSPYGAWLAISNNPTTDTFSDWFRNVPTKNQVLEQNLTMVYQGGTTYRSFETTFFPLDGEGYDNQGQIDCYGKEHNFGFTSAMRLGLKYQGKGKITVAGGDELWVYVNKVLVAKVVSDAYAPNIPCKVVDLTPAATKGGATITPQSGNLAGVSCANLVPASSEAVHLELEAGLTYHFSLFHVKRKKCKSIFLFQTEDITWALNVPTSANIASLTTPAPGSGGGGSSGSSSGVDEPPVDYIVSIPENLHVNGIVETLFLTDPFSTGPNFVSSIIYGNEARHFTIKGDTSANRAAAVAATTAPPAYTTLPGVNISFIECSSPPTITPDPYTAGKETFTLSTTKGLLTLKTSVDYEAAQRYYLTLEVEDPGTTPALTGVISVLIRITDVNDNCPVLNVTSFVLEPRPSLQIAPSVQLQASDIDSTVNAEIIYMASTPSFYPPLNRYNPAVDDLLRVVYVQNSTVTVKVVAIDKGSPPRGAVGTLNITLINSCLIDTLYQSIDIVFVVNETTGDVYLRVPKYWVFKYDCQDIIGVAKGYVLETYMTASTYQRYSAPGRARMNITYDATGLLTGGWVPEVSDTNQWLQIDMNAPHKFRKVMTQGRQDAANWVKTYKLLYSQDATSFTEYTDAGGNNIFTGNTDQNSIVTQDLVPPIMARAIRFNPRTWHVQISIRVELVGCSQEKQLYFDTTCERCLTSWYCVGDGEMRPCGRCDPPQSGNKCGRHATEHSFGMATECASCPTGWICNDGVAKPCTLGFYSACTNSSCPTTCNKCEPGYACSGGQRTLCGPGTYSDGTPQFCEMCKPGTYQNASAQTTCMNCPKGFRSTMKKSKCEPCPEKTYSLGDGSGCRSCPSENDCRCMKSPYPCFKESPCYNVEGSKFICGPCPDGYAGDGTACTDIDECAVHKPCWNNTCRNTQPGYQCLKCPPGYEGTFEDGLSYTVKRRVFASGSCNSEHDSVPQQRCWDINECLTNNGGCDANSQCINSIGSFTCGFCNTGYIKDPIYGCIPQDFCASNNHNCHTNATCVYVLPGIFRCECNIGFAGDGVMCGTDNDMDGNPFDQLVCQGKSCNRDNCNFVPNSGQEDSDNDYVGDGCDPDSDNDGIFDDNGHARDNCRFKANYNQEDADSDGVGDACDNCPNNWNYDQKDTDGDGKGDVCDTDDDNDGKLDTADNCPLVANPGQENTKDSDNVGDACDNCPHVNNNDQADSDDNGVGDACDPPGTGKSKDRDGDGILNFMDNCPYAPNAEQADNDGDGLGDACDDDLDGDSVKNSKDNCPYQPNANQADVNGNGLGDVCEEDTDGDGAADLIDFCPKNKNIKTTTMSPYISVNLDPGVTSLHPEWEITHSGAEVKVKGGTGIPVVNMSAILIGPQSYGDMDYHGTWFVNTDQGQDYIGFVFGYQNNRRFYVVMWRNKNLNYAGDLYRAGIKGIQIKLVDSTTGPGSAMGNAIWHSATTTDEVKLLWHEPAMTGWKHKTAYRWHLEHRPSIGRMRVKVYQGENLIVDSPYIYDATLLGGKVGVFVFSQPEVIWSNLQVRCYERLNLALNMDGVDDYVELEQVPTLEMTQSFTWEAWIIPRSVAASVKQPVVCTLDSKVCMYVQNQLLTAQVGSTIVTGKTAIPENYWTHLTMRYSYETHFVTLWVNGSTGGTERNQKDIDPPVWDLNVTSTDNSTRLYIGRDANSFFSGIIDEVRLYGMYIYTNKLNSYIFLPDLEWITHKMQAEQYFKMDDNSNPSVLKNDGHLNYTGTVHGSPTYVESWIEHGRFQVTYPNNR